MDIKITLTDTEYAILRTHLTDPEAWAKRVIAEKLRKCTNRVYEATTGKVAQRQKMPDKLKELEKFNIKPRQVGDKKSVLKHAELKEVKNG